MFSKEEIKRIATGAAGASGEGGTGISGEDGAGANDPVSVLMRADGVDRRSAESVCRFFGGTNTDAAGSSEDADSTSESATDSVAGERSSR